MMEAKTRTFYAPCPVLDIETMQTWLEDMAMEGYLLKGCSRTRHKFEFYEIEPLHTRYRLTPVSDKIEEWNLKPDEEFVSISKAYGWEHVCSNYRLHFFRTFDEEAREIHTDPAIQAQAIRQLSRRIIKTALIWFSLPLIYLLMLFTLGGVNNFWQNLIAAQTGLHITMAYFVLFAMVKTVLELVPLCRLYKRVKQGYVPVNRKEWEKKAPAYRVAFRVYPIILIILALVVVIGRAAYRDNVAYKNLPPVGMDLPFMSVADMAQKSDIQSAERMEQVNYMRNWSHILSPVNYDWAEIVKVVGNDGNEGLVSIHVFYHEARYSWFAEALTREYIAKAKQTGTEITDKLQTAADQVYFYYNEFRNPSAVLRYGNAVICVEFPRADIDNPTLKPEYWVKSLDYSLCDK